MIEDSNLRDLNQDGLTSLSLSDITVEHEGIFFNLHKCILTFNSGYFRSLLQDSDTSIGTVSLRASCLGSQSSSTMLSDIFRFMYTKHISFTSNNVHQILAIAHFLKIDELESKAIDFLLALDDSSCLDTDMEEEESIQGRNVNDNDNLTYTKQSNYMDNFIPSESDATLDCISDIESEVLDISSSEASSIYCDKKISQRYHVEKTSVANSDSVWDFDSCENNSSNLCRSGFPIHSAPSPPSFYGSTTAVLDCYLYLIGGVGNEESIWSYNANNNIWNLQSEHLNQGRAFSSTIVADHKSLYVIGGSSKRGKALSTIEEFKLKEDGSLKRSTTFELVRSRCDHASVCSQGLIFTLGGRKGHLNWDRLKHAEVCDISTRLPISLHPMNHARCKFSAVVYEDSIIVVGGFHAEEYSLATGQWTDLPSLMTARHGHSACVLDSKMYIMGGGRSKYIDILDLQTYSWSSVNTKQFSNKNKNKLTYFRI